MSSVYLLKDRPPAKKGDIVSVPFVIGQQMVADGEAVYPGDKPEPTVEPVAPKPEKPDPKPAEPVSVKSKKPESPAKVVEKADTGK